MFTDADVISKLLNLISADDVYACNDSVTCCIASNRKSADEV